MNIVTLDVRYEHDVVASRQRARQIAAFLGFDPQEQTRIATAVSEVVRNAFQYAGGGRVAFSFEGKPIPVLWARVSDSGPGIGHLAAVLGGGYVSQTGMGIGLIGSKRLMDRFEVITAPGKGTQVVLGKELGKVGRVPGPADIARISQELATRRPDTPFEEIQRQNQELVRALDELRAKSAELARLNQELEDTNRGVVALYAELDEKAESLRVANETKTSFLANMTHEFRTPVNSILNLSRLLLDRMDGELTAEQEKQVRYIQKSALGLSDLVNDLLDIAKVEAGRIAVRPEAFQLDELVSTLRGALKPLSSNHPDVHLVFEETAGFPVLRTDEGKLAQILRNLVSNALKYTERGEVRLSAAVEPGGIAAFSVTDTGIGIRAEDQETIFEEFSQIDSPLQRRFKGTGLGLPLSRKLAQLLGGSLTVSSQPGRGSTFVARVPLEYSGGEDGSIAGAVPGARLPGLTRAVPPASGLRVLVVDDDPAARYLVAEALRQARQDGRVEVTEAADGETGLARARGGAFDLVILDLNMPGRDGFEVLRELKRDPSTRQVPIVIHSSHELVAEEVSELEGVDMILPKDDRGLPALVERLRAVLEGVRDAG